MKLKLVGLVASIVASVVQAVPGSATADGGCWPSTVTQTVVSTQVQWSTTTQVQYSTKTDTVTNTVTNVVTSTQVQYSTKTNTVTNTVTDTVTSVQVSVTTSNVPGPTVTVTNHVTDVVTSTVVSATTVVQPTTVVSTTTIVQPTTVVSTTTVVVPTTTTVRTTVVQTTTVVQPTTVIQPTTVVQPTTVIQPSTVVSRTTVVSSTTVSRTVTTVNLSTITNTVSTTITRTSTNTVSTCPTTALTGLVTCTSRIVNPTYTPPAPLPSNYLWGCPPGTICTPPQIGCNWEQNPPADTYVCKPSECKPVPGLPNITDYNSLWPNPTVSTCAWYNPVLGYFHLNPEHFGLSFAIFNVYGQPVCPTTEKPKTYGWVDWIKPKPSSPPKLSRRVTGPNPLAQILRRQSLAVAPAACYAVFDAATTVAENTGHVYPRLCPAGTQFQNAVSACRSCASANSGTSSQVDSFPELQSYLTWCANNAP